MEEGAALYDFLARVAAYIDANDIRDLRREWGRTAFEEVTVYVWSRVPCLVRRLVKLVEGAGP
jgi:hypothetical protein